MFRSWQRAERSMIDGVDVTRECTRKCQMATASHNVDDAQWPFTPIGWWHPSRLARKITKCVSAMRPVRAHVAASGCLIPHSSPLRCPNRVRWRLLLCRGGVVKLVSVRIVTTYETTKSLRPLLPSSDNPAATRHLPDPIRHLRAHALSSDNNTHDRLGPAHATPPRTPLAFRPKHFRDVSGQTTVSRAS